MTNPGGPQLLGIDVLWVATMLSAVAAVAVIFAIYAAVTVRDPMTKRVKALSERREQLKAGITATTSKKRAKLVRKTETTDKMRQMLSKLQVLQEDQIKIVQQKLAQAGIRRKELAVTVIFSRLVLPVIFGGGAALWIYGFGGMETYSTFKRFAAFAIITILGYKA
eukprot:gene34624-57434_t